jgi:hypothetical protein
MPVFRRLLEKAEEEFEFHYHGGAVTIPCDTKAFRYILVVVMDRHRQGLVDDGTLPPPHLDRGQRDFSFLGENWAVEACRWSWA